VRDQGEAESQTLGAPKKLPLGHILADVKDVRRGINPAIGRKAFFEMTSYRNMPPDTSMR